MAYEMKDGDFSLFRNDKEGNEKRPDMRGKACIGGVIYKLSGWTRKTKDGEKYLAGKIEPEQRTGFAPKPQEPEQTQPERDQSSLPF